jgi:hypothetical protein
MTNNNGFWIGFIDTYTFTQFGTTGKYSAIAILQIFQLTVAHALGFSVFTSRILATDLSQSRCNFKSHMKSSLHRIIPFLPFLLLPIPRLDSTTLDYCCILLFTPLPPSTTYNHLARTSRKHRLYCWRSIFTAPLPSNRCAYRPVA